MQLPTSGFPVRALLVASFLALVALPLAAQPAAVVNAASFANAALPNGSIAQGSLFTIFGSNMGPAEIVRVSAFPLPTELGGTSVQVTVGGQTVDCIMIFTLAGQVAAVLPSSTPLGDGTLAVTFNGQQSSSIPITVVAHSFGIFARNSAGSGPGVFTNAFDPLSSASILNSAKPGEFWDIWGTGLGPVQASPEAEADRALPGNLPYDVQVLVGSTIVQADYRGRSGCCVGVDQIRFVVPSGITGCYVPVAVIVGGITSNFTTMAISENGGPCSDPGSGIGPDVLSQAQAQGGLRVATINGNRSRSEFDIPQGQALNFTTISDSVSASFQELTVPQIEATAGFGVRQIGACVVFQFRNSSDSRFQDPIAPTPLDAGDLTLSGPEGMRTIPKLSDGSYFELLTSIGSMGGYFQPGSHTVTGKGGTAIGPFSAMFDVGNPLEWTNPTSSISRSSSFTVEWQGGTGDRVIIWGVSPYSAGEELSSGVAFWCDADRAAGSFTIPQPVVGSLPPTATIEGMAAGVFGLGDVSLENVSIPDVDVGVSSYSDMLMRIGVDYP